MSEDKKYEVIVTRNSTTGIELILEPKCWEWDVQEIEGRYGVLASGSAFTRRGALRQGRVAATRLRTTGTARRRYREEV